MDSKTGYKLKSEFELVFPFDSEQKALDAMNSLAQSAIEHYKSLKNQNP